MIMLCSKCGTEIIFHLHDEENWNYDIIKNQTRCKNCKALNYLVHKGMEKEAEKKGYRLAIPLKKKKSHTGLKFNESAEKVTTLRIKRLQYAELKRIAELEGYSMADILNESIKLRIDQHIKQEKKRQKERLKTA